MDPPARKSRCCSLVQTRFIPLVFLTAFASSPNTMLFQQYAYQRYAEEAGLQPANMSFQNSSVCLEHHEDNTTDAIQDHVQRQASYFNMYMTIALTLPSLITLPLWGALSDIVGRKVPLVMSYAGTTVRALVFLAVVMLHWPLWVILLGEIVHGIMGFNIGTVCYVSSAHIADYCPSRSRTLEMVLLDLWLTLGYVVGSLLSGYALKNLGYTNPVLGYTVPILGVALMQIVLTLYVVFALPKFRPKRALTHVTAINAAAPEEDSNHNPAPNHHTPAPGSNTPASNDYNSAPEDDKMDDDDPLLLAPTFLHNFRSIVTSTLRKSTRVLIRSPCRELLLLTAIYCLYGAVGGALSENLSTYAMGFPLCWRAMDLSLYKAAQLGVQGTTGTGLSLLWQRRGWWLEMLVLAGLISGMLQNIVVGTATTTPQMFCSVLAGACALVVPPTIRSLATPMVDPTDQGALMSSLYNVETLSRLISIIGFNFLYTATLSIYEGLVFLVAASLFLPSFPLLWKVYKIRSLKLDWSLLNSEVRV